MKNNRSGFTLIEMMVVLVLVSLLLVGVSTLLLTNLKGGGKATLIANLRDEGEAAMIAMERELRFGFSPICSDPDDEVSFIIKDLENKNEDAVRYRFSAGKIQRSDEVNVDGEFINFQDLIGGDNIIISTVDRVFTCETALTSFESVNVTLAFTVSSDEDSQVSQNFRTTISMRNKE